MGSPTPEAIGGHQWPQDRDFLHFVCFPSFWQENYPEHVALFCLQISCYSILHGLELKLEQFKTQNPCTKLHSEEEDNLSPFDWKTITLCQSIKINNNKNVYCQSQVRKPISSEVKWAECSLTIGTGCWVKVFAWCLIAQSIFQWGLSLLAIQCLIIPSFKSCIQQRKTTSFILICKLLACTRASTLTTPNIYYINPVSFWNYHLYHYGRC